MLAVCSCTVLPLFAGIYKRGAGLGPAIAFLFSGPAINVLAIVYSAKLLGYDIGIARAVASIAFSVIVGLIMAFIYRKEKSQADAKAFAMLTVDPADKSIWQQVVFLASLVAPLYSKASERNCCSFFFSVSCALAKSGCFSLM